MRAALSNDDATLVLRPGTFWDEDAVAALHSRCSMKTLFNRYHSGMSTVPRRWVHRLLNPPRGTTVLGFADDQVVALGQLIGTVTPGVAEVSLLVEDAWQRRGVGAALLEALAANASREGYRELVAWCLPSENALARTAGRAGLVAVSRREDGLSRVSIALPAGAVMAPIAAVASGK